MFTVAERKSSKTPGRRKPVGASAGKTAASVKETGSAGEHLYFFHEGTDCRAYEILGAHVQKNGVIFRVWAPNAQEVSVVGDFNSWDNSKHPMSKISVGVWELSIEGVKPFDAYKYAVKTSCGSWLEKSDPYAFHAETRPRTASKVFDLSGYRWKDEAWTASRQDMFDKPVNIYEIHPGSWRRAEDSRMLSYGEMAERLVPYVKEMGYTHVELMPVMEHPLDMSWGYQVTGYFAANSRFGTPNELMLLIDRFHQEGIGVILDWVPAHFPKDGHGLIEFDGTCCYEYSDPAKREHSDWGTRVFDYGRNETRSFLMSSAMFWMDVFHADGLRVDAVASMLYLDYGRSDGQWQPNIYGGRENLEAISFLQKLNEQIFASFPHALMIAEESTAWPLVTKPVYMGGLGFNFKWNMGWMNDTLHYMKLDPIFRQYNHNDLTFSMMYAFSENYLLPLSHDEVVHGKCSLIEKMPGYYTDKFAGVRACLAYQVAHVGKILTFMGMEFGQFIEWNYNQSLDWHLLDTESHRKLHKYVKALNHFYRQHSELWENDADWDGFRWLNHGDYQGNTLSFVRINRLGSEMVCVFNFSPLFKPGYRVGVPKPGHYKQLLNSGFEEFGGPGVRYTEHWTDAVYCDEQPQSVMLDLAPYSALFLKEVY